MLSLLAPGAEINSSIPTNMISDSCLNTGGGSASCDGTSMAAPHVTGAWAVLKQRRPGASVAQILSALKNTGLSIHDARNGLTRPRIRIDRALQALRAIPADFNNDGKADLLWQHTDGSVATWTMNGTVRVSGQVHFGPQPDTNWKIVGTGDLDGNGSADIVWRNQVTGSLTGWLMNGVTVVTGSNLTPAAVPDTNWTIRALGDLNNDGKADLIWQNTADGRISVWLMNGLSQIRGHLLSPGIVSDTNWHIVGTGDIDGNGSMDLFWQHQGDGRISAWLMNGQILAQGVLLSPGQVADTGWKIRGVSDVNGDARPDLIWQHQDGRISAWIMNGTQLTSGTPFTPGQIDTNWKIVGPR
jgi:hypothetical protein